MIEGAFLAGLIQAPSSYDPIRRPQQSRRRFAEVLDALVEVGLTTATEAEAITVCLDPTAPEAESEQCVGSWQIPEVVRTITEKDHSHALQRRSEVVPFKQEQHSR